MSNLFFMRNLRVLRFYVQTNNLTCHNFINAGKRPEPPGTETKESFPTVIAVARILFSYLIPRASVHLGQPSESQQTTTHTYNGLHYRKNPMLREPKYFITGCRQTHQTFVTEGDICIILGMFVFKIMIFIL